MKRFWAQAQARAIAQGFEVQLDGKPLKLPGGEHLILPFPRLAEAIATEWDELQGNFTLEDLLLTRLAGTAQHQVAPKQPEIILQLTEFGLNDLLCYRSSNQPALATREASSWQPWIDWAEQSFGVSPQTGNGLMPITQSPAFEAALRAALGRMTIYQLAGLGVIVPALGSLILGLAIEAGALAPAAAFDCANLEALWQESIWGQDAAAQNTREHNLRNITVAAQFMALCGD